MGKFEKYRIDLKGMKENHAHYDFLLDNAFFAAIDSPELQKGKVTVQVDVKKTAQAFELSFNSQGTVVVLCDRCLDEMDQEISSTDKIFVKFGAEYADEGDNLIIVPEDEGDINVAWIMYEYIALAIPMKHVHAPGKCNKTMSGKLNKYLRTSADYMDEMEPVDDPAEDESNIVSDEENDKPIDPRWSELQKLL